MRKIKIIECPRDAMQGWNTFIPTDIKIKYINALLKAGFDTIDFGSFVSPKAIPQMADTAEVLNKLDDSPSDLLAIIANERGAEDAVSFERINFLGYPFSISETFQLRNTNSTIEHSFKRVQNIQELCIKHKKQLVVYLSMGFGNPYGDPYSEEIAAAWVTKLAAAGIKIISIADTVGLATPQQVSSLVSQLIPAFPSVEVGVHLHSRPDNRLEKLSAAFNAGCIRFDGAIKGIGGCPMAGDDLVGNMDTEMMIGYFEHNKLNTGVNMEALRKCSMMASEVFANHN